MGLVEGRGPWFLASCWCAAEPVAELRKLVEELLLPLGLLSAWVAFKDLGQDRPHSPQLTEVEAVARESADQVHGMEALDVTLVHAQEPKNALRQQAFCQSQWQAPRSQGFEGACANVRGDQTPEVTEGLEAFVLVVFNPLLAPLLLPSRELGVELDNGLPFGHLGLGFLGRLALKEQILHCNLELALGVVKAHPGDWLGAGLL
mmetsp:Transcript_14688/g.43495  ORF Transcript_14688/g.43495 Transcript_14688/m.43495 type:complete len:204 (+) Transcript_14688:1870-2481(+)